MIDETTDYVERMYRAELDSSNPHAEDAGDLYTSWLIPDEDDVINILINLGINPPDHVKGENGDILMWEEVVSHLLSKATGDNERRIEMLREQLTDPEVRRLTTLSLGRHIGGDARSLLIDDLVALVPQMSEFEIDQVIEDLLLTLPDGRQRTLELLKTAPPEYRPFPAYMLGRLPTHTEAEQGRVPPAVVWD